MIRVRADKGMERALTGFGTALRRAGSESVARSALKLKADLRQDVLRGGLGARLSRSWQAKVYPDKPGKTPTALVYSKAPHIIRGHSEGGTIRSRNGFWLAIPTAAVPRQRGRGPLRPGELERRLGLRLRFIYRRGRVGLLVADNATLSTRGRLRTLNRQSRGGGQFTALTAGNRRTGVSGRATVVLYVLVPFVRLPRRLLTERVIRQSLDALTRELDAAISRRRPS
ncbi:MAG TPA: DUF6441 family protein [Pseudohaliea sp.]|nr:DUF6441 family protein [Pseudohaliea sp.]